MAKIIYELRKNMNTASKTYGQWYAHVKTVETMNTRKGISGTVLNLGHFSRQMKMKQKSIQTISKCWTSENDRENRPRESQNNRRPSNLVCSGQRGLFAPSKLRVKTPFLLMGGKERGLEADSFYCIMILMTAVTSSMSTLSSPFTSATDSLKGDGFKPRM